MQSRQKCFAKQVQNQGRSKREQNLPFSLAKPFKFVKRRRPINVTHSKHILFSPRGFMKPSYDLYCLYLPQCLNKDIQNIQNVTKTQRARAQSRDHRQPFLGLWEVVQGHGEEHRFHRFAHGLQQPRGHEPLDVTSAAATKAAQSQNEQTCCGTVMQIVKINLGYFTEASNFSRFKTKNK